jgi:hypothetical protein
MQDAESGELMLNLEEEDEDLNRLLDLNRDPLIKAGEGPTTEWLDQIDKIQPRTLKAPDPETQRQAIRTLLETIENEPREPDAENFVAGSFQAYLPA